MKTIFIAIFIGASAGSFGQVDISVKNVKQAIAGAEIIVKSLLGNDLYKRYITVDTIDSRHVTSLVYSNDIKNPRFLRIDTSFILYFNVINGKDSIGFFNLYVNRFGKLVKDSNDPMSFSGPELILGYKKELENGFKINFNKATAMGRQKGFTAMPYLNAENEYRYTTINNDVYIKVKYFWSFIEFTGTNPGFHILNINAETGEIEKEEHTPPMPK